MISVDIIDNTSLVCDPKWVSYALEQAERLVSHDRAKKVLHNFDWNPLYSGGNKFIVFCSEAATLQNTTNLFPLLYYRKY